MKTLLKILPLILLVACNTATTKKSETSEISIDTTAVKIAEGAYLYGMPLVLMDLTRKKTTNVEAPVDGLAAPINQFYISTEFPNASFRAFVKPNADTFYNTAMLDLSAEPMVLTIANTDGRYYLMPMLDAFTNVFFSPGKRTTGTKKQIYLIAGPNWQGEVPEGLESVKAPTNLVWVVGRIQVNSPKDAAEFVIPLEKENTLVPLSSYGKPYTAPKGVVNPDYSKNSVVQQLVQMSTNDFFNYVNKLLVTNPPAEADTPAMDAFNKIGVGAGLAFSLDNFNEATQQALNSIPKNVIGKINETVSKGLVKPINGWSIAYKGFGDFKTNYQLRAAVSLVGLGANLPQDAIYPLCSIDTEGQPLDGKNKYVINFEKGQTPPVHAFWSLSMYNKEGYFVENPINRFAIGDRDALKFNKDGTVTLYLQNESPGKEKESNWLPCPTDGFDLVLRLYWPKEEMIEGKWIPAGVQKVSE
jgi:DNA sulfur modification protein DndE